MFESLIKRFILVQIIHLNMCQIVVFGNFVEKLGSGVVSFLKQND